MEMELDAKNYYGGTTIMAAEFDGGVVLGSDSRTSCRGYVSNRNANKLTRISDHIYCCRSGSASQTQRLADRVGLTISNYQFRTGQPCRVKDAAVQFRNRIYLSQPRLMASIIVAGWDRVEGGQVYSAPVTGLLIRESFAMGGSGSPYVQGFIAANYKQGMSQDETVELITSAVKLAMQHDCSSGGIVRIGVITKDGMTTHIAHNKDTELTEFTNSALWNLHFGI